jgi:hypothetical protein
MVPMTLGATHTIHENSKGMRLATFCTRNAVTVAM